MQFAYICFPICLDELLYLFETQNAYDYRLGALATAKNKSLAKPFPWIPILQTSTNRFATINKLSLFDAISTCRTGQSVCSDNIFFLFFFRKSQLIYFVVLLVTSANASKRLDFFKVFSLLCFYLSRVASILFWYLFSQWFNPLLCWSLLIAAFGQFCCRLSHLSIVACVMRSLPGFT